MQIYNQKPSEPSSEFSFTDFLLKRLSFQRKNLISLPNFYCSKFTEFFQGNEAFQDIEHAETIRESLRKNLEEIDLLNGVQILSDCDSGFGSYTYFQSKNQDKHK